jgi:hypothetical protein
LVGEPGGASQLRALRAAALADDNGVQLERALASLRIHPPVAA